MAFLEIDVTDLDGLGPALRQFNRFHTAFRNKLPRVVLGAHKKQIVERIRSKKSGPDGEVWPAWSEQYAKTRTGAHSLLIGERKLVNAWQTVVSAGQGSLTNTAVYAAAQHFGFEDIPARPYAGVGSTDTDDLQHVINTWVSDNLELV